VSTHWTEQFLGIPFLLGGRDPSKGLDCWGLLREVYLKVLNIQLPNEASEAAVNDRRHHEFYLQQMDSGNWTRTETPEDGDMVALGRGREVHHTGIYIASKPPCILHSYAHTSMIQDMRVMQRSGWNTIIFYRHAQRNQQN
jgi:cell wall-associated NlpC family hydrolase